MMKAALMAGAFSFVLVACQKEDLTGPMNVNTATSTDIELAQDQFRTMDDGTMTERIANFAGSYQLVQLNGATVPEDAITIDLKEELHSVVPFTGMTSCGQFSGTVTILNDDAVSVNIDQGANSICNSGMVADFMQAMTGSTRIKMLRDGLAFARGNRASTMFERVK